MNPRSTRRLIGLNAALLGILAVVTVVGTRAGAQQGAQQGAQANARARGVYTMVAGEIQGSSTDAIYIFDASNQEVVALVWDRSRNRFDGIGYRNLPADAAGPRQSR